MQEYFTKEKAAVRTLFLILIEKNIIFLSVGFVFFELVTS